MAWEEILARKYNLIKDVRKDIGLSILDTNSGLCKALEKMDVDFSVIAKVESEKRSCRRRLLSQANILDAVCEMNSREARIREGIPRQVGIT